MRGDGEQYLPQHSTLHHSMERHRLGSTGNEFPGSDQDEDCLANPTIHPTQTLLMTSLVGHRPS